jgi:hypothetical protein
MLLLIHASERGYESMPETLIAVCDICGKPFTSLAAAWLGYARPARPGERIPPRWLHKKCAQAQPPPDGAQEHLWRADFALYSLVKGLLRPSEIPLAVRKDLPGARQPWGNP